MSSRTTVSVSAWRMWRSYSAYFSGCTAPMNSREPASGWRSCKGSSPATVVAFGPMARSTKVRRSALHCLQEIRMDESPAEILLAEDSDADAELTLRALRKGNLVNKVLRVRDGVEALEYIFH